jgi:hypothetical protein
MSYTVIPSPHEAERTMTNEVNRAARRCRIGKIKCKHDYRGLRPALPTGTRPIFGPYVDPFAKPTTGEPYVPAWWERVTC